MRMRYTPDMSMDDVKSEARMKGLAAFAGLVVAVLLFWVHWVLGIVGSGVAVALVLRWFAFRAKWGMKF